MVSSVESGGVEDTEAGTIVWVRRRNGSWWPGRILGPQDLGASHLMSPRSGTPVKLLGREDASVDWYNLEKSKRVKAFRCGEFDDCIERAAASHGLPAKKREKYARREDAILHALELEKQFVEKKCAKSVKSKGKSTEAERKPSTTTVKVIENGNGKLDSNELCQPGKRVDKSYLVEKNGVPSLAQRAKHPFHPGLEDHSIIMGSQIKELKDVGLKAVPLNTMLYSATSKDSNRTAIDGQVYGVSGNGPCLDNSTDSDSRNSLGKGKRLLDGYVEEPIPKRHRINHPFVNVRPSSEELPSHSLRPDMYAWGLSAEGARCSKFMPAESSHMFSNKPGLQGYTELPFSRSEVGANSAQLGTLAEETISGSSEETEYDSSETHSIDQNVVKGMLLSDAETSVRALPRLCDISTMQVGPESISSDESDEVSFVGKSHLNYVEHNLSSDEVSRWQLKSKRNIRNTGKRNTQKTYLDARRVPLTLTETSHSQSYGHDNGFSNEAVFSEEDFNLQPVGYGQRGYLPFQAVAKRHNYAGPNMIDWESGLGRSLRFWGERSECFSPMFIGRSGHDMLIDVDLQVQATRVGEHVPWVSLMSKLNGKAIIGHPVQIESLEDGSTDVIFLSTSDEELRYECDRDNVPPMWKTARRTANVRAIRPHQLSQSQLEIDENTGYQPTHHMSGKRESKKSPAPTSGRKGSLSKITNSHVSRPPQGTNKVCRKVNSLSNQKTKPLSSLGFNQVTNRTSGKPVVTGSTTVACIPVKLAFSRLLEAVGRP